MLKNHKIIQPPMHADERRLKTMSLFTFIRVDLRPITQAK
jgi:hypothetical protein